MSDTSAAAAFNGAPASVLNTVDVVEPPVPGGAAPTQRPKVSPPAAKPAAKRTTKRGAKRAAAPRAKTTSSSSTADAVNAAAEAAATALERETGTAKRGRPSVADVKNEQLAEGLRNFYVGIGGMLVVFGTLLKVRGLERFVLVGRAMMIQADDCAKALVAAADQSQAVRQALEFLTKAGGASLVLAAHGPILLAALGVDPEESTPGDLSDGQAVGMDIASLLGMMGGFSEMMGGFDGAASGPV